MPQPVGSELQGFEMESLAQYADPAPDMYLSHFHECHVAPERYRFALP